MAPRPSRPLTTLHPVLIHARDNVLVRALVVEDELKMAALTSCARTGAARDRASDPAPGKRLTLPPAQDEIRKLGETLNRMLGRLETALARERRFVADASHELRTPLAMLRTELELGLRRGRSQEELEQAVRSAFEETERLARLAEDLLVLASSENGELPVRVAPLPASDLLGGIRERFLARASDAGREYRDDDGSRRDRSRRPPAGRASARQPRRQCASPRQRAHRPRGNGQRLTRRAPCAGRRARLPSSVHRRCVRPVQPRRRGAHRPGRRPGARHRRGDRPRPGARRTSPTPRVEPTPGSRFRGQAEFSGDSQTASLGWVRDGRGTELRGKRSLVKLGGAAVAAFAGGAQSRPRTPHRLGPTAVASGAVSCVLAPEQTEGPYYVPGDRCGRTSPRASPACRWR